MIRFLRRILNKLADWNDPGCRFDDDERAHGVWVMTHSKRSCTCFKRQS